jgi:hypothetical protein
MNEINIWVDDDRLNDAEGHSARMGVREQHRRQQEVAAIGDLFVHIKLVAGGTNEQARRARSGSCLGPPVGSVFRPVPLPSDFENEDLLSSTPQFGLEDP